MNKLYLILGFQENIKNSHYQDLIKSVENYYEVVPIELGLIDLVYTFGKDKTFAEVIARAKNQIIGDISKDIILGFSIGGLVAYQLSTKIKFKKVIVCSICSILEGDLNLYPQEEANKIFTSKQIKEISSLKYEAPLSPLVLFFGIKETKQVIRRSKILNKKFGGAIFKIKGTGHDLSGKYLEEVKRVI